MVTVTQKILDDIFNIYRGVTGWRPVGRRPERLQYPQVRDVVEYGGTLEYKTGSKWGPLKFMIEGSIEGECIVGISRVYFHPNYEPRGKREKQQIKKAQELFETKVKEYFNSIKQTE